MLTVTERGAEISPAPVLESHGLCARGREFVRSGDLAPGTLDGDHRPQSKLRDSIAARNCSR